MEARGGGGRTTGRRYGCSPSQGNPIEPQPIVRPLIWESAAEAKDLLDRCFGAGFGEMDETDMGFTAYHDSCLVGVMTVALRSPAGLNSHYAGRVSWPGDSFAQVEVALIRQIGVTENARGMGVGDALMVATTHAVADHFEDRVRYLVANAWVHARTGRCPAAHLLERHGFTIAGAVPNFFAAMPSEDCPGCSTALCRCSVRVYFKEQPARQPA